MSPRVSHSVIAAAAIEQPWLTNKEVGAQFGVSEATVRRALDSVANERPKLLVPSIEIESPLTVHVTEPVDITADYHFPLTRYDLVERQLDQARADGVKILIIAGDLLHADTPSAFDYKQESANMQLEKDTATAFINAAAEVYDDIVIGWGNHDARYQKRLSYGVKFSETMKMMLEGRTPEANKKIRWTNLDHVIACTDFGVWYICHPKTYSQIPLSQARKIASKQLCNVITAHSHHHAVGHDVSGAFTVAEIGGYFNAGITEYLQRSTSFPNWQNGMARLHPDNLLEMRSEQWIMR